jgi:hypothetical protein
MTGSSLELQQRKMPESGAKITLIITPFICSTRVRDLSKI